MVSDAEVRAVISTQLVIDSARAAGLEAAFPIAAGSDDIVVVYGGEDANTGPLSARRVEVRVFDVGLEDAALAVPVPGGAVVALVEWGGVGDGDGVFLLAGPDIEGVQNGTVVLGDRRATAKLWKALVLG